MILWCIGGDDAAEEAQDDGIERSVPARLDQIINMKHELVGLAGRIDWDWIDGEIALLYSENGRLGIATRFMIGLLSSSTFTASPTKARALGSTTHISSSSPAKSSSSHLPHERSDLSHWRKRLGDKLERRWPRATVAHEAGVTQPGPQAGHGRHHGGAAGRPSSPTDAKLLHAAIRGLNRLARKHGIRLRQFYARGQGRRDDGGRYAHEQFRRHQRHYNLRSRSTELSAARSRARLSRRSPSCLAGPPRIRSQQQRQRG